MADFPLQLESYTVFAREHDSISGRPRKRDAAYRRNAVSTSGNISVTSDDLAESEPVPNHDAHLMLRVSGFEASPRIYHIYHSPRSHTPSTPEDLYRSAGQMAALIIN